jgi:prophage regulatory protein
MSAIQSLIRLPEVRRLTGLSRTSIYRLEREGRFVARVRIGDRAIAWRLAEVVAWIERRPLADAVPVPVGRGETIQGRRSQIVPVVKS